jgi:hypothetical protein
MRRASIAVPIISPATFLVLGCEAVVAVGLDEAFRSAIGGAGQIFSGHGQLN